MPESSLSACDKTSRVRALIGLLFSFLQAVTEENIVNTYCSCFDRAALVLGQTTVSAIRETAARIHTFSPDEIIEVCFCMALFYRGAGPGTYWHRNDPYHQGFIPHSPGVLPSPSLVLNHIATGTVGSPYISLTRSYSVARGYALVGPSGFATAAKPGFIYVIDISTDKTIKMLDPIKAIARGLPKPWAEPYHHDGDQRFLLGVIDPVAMRTHLKRQCFVPSGSGATPKTPTLSLELAALTRALRDAEILIQGAIPHAYIVQRYEVY
jgi:hypothetical protein